VNTKVITQLDEIAKKLDGEGQALLKDLVSLVGNEPENLVAMLQTLAAFDWRYRPVDMETFLTNPSYLGLRGQIFPKLQDDLIELFEGGDYNEAVLAGGIGYGKSTFAECALLRMVYEVSCLKDPQRAYGLMEGSHIAFINASVNLTQAQKVVFHGISAKINNSPYFRDFFAHDQNMKKELRFPRDVWVAPVAASSGGTIGYNVFGGVLDEVNFWAVTEKSQQNRGQKFDQARHVYDMLIRRIKSRFSRGGKLPGVLIQVSSSKYPDDFTEQRFQEVEETKDTTTMCRRYSTWETKPREWFQEDVFYLFRGTSGERPYLTKDKNEVADKNPELVHTVPMDFWLDFSRDIDGSIRDILGFPTLSIRPFLPEKDKITDAFERAKRRGLVHPYSVEETTLEDGAYFDTTKIKFDPRKRYYAHVDLALRKDACGIAVGHVDGFTEITRRNREGHLVKDRLPIIIVDFMLRVRAPEHEEIKVDLVRALLLEMRSYGCNFKKITFDQYQSASSIQAFQRIGIESERFSVDRPMAAYNAFKESLLEDRLVLYSYEPFLEEAVRLEKNEQKDKVDHPPKSSKDITDAVAGVVSHCTEEAMNALMDPSYGITVSGQGAAIPGHWLNVVDGLEPTVDEKGKLKPGIRKRTVDDLLFPEEEDKEPGFYGFL
jgi:hypothetical protein